MGKKILIQTKSVRIFSFCQNIILSLLKNRMLFWWSLVVIQKLVCFKNIKSTFLELYASKHSFPGSQGICLNDIIFRVALQDAFH